MTKKQHIIQLSEDGLGTHEIHHRTQYTYNTIRKVRSLAGYTKGSVTKKMMILDMLDKGASVKLISETLKVDTSYVYRVQMKERPTEKPIIHNECMSAIEIAKVMGLSTSTIERILHMALCKMNAYMKSKDIQPADLTIEDELSSINLTSFQES